MRVTLKPAWLALASTLALGACNETTDRCGAGTDIDLDAATDAGADVGGLGQLVIGQGETAYARLRDGEALTFEHGAQGGQHVYVSLRITGLRPERVLLEARTEVEGYPDLVLERSGRLTFTRERSDAEPDASAADGGNVHDSFEYIGWPAQILGAVDHVGERAILRMQVTDLDGSMASARKTIVIAEP